MGEYGERNLASVRSRSYIQIDSDHRLLANPEAN